MVKHHAPLQDGGSINLNGTRTMKSVCGNRKPTWKYDHRQKQDGVKHKMIYAETSPLLDGLASLNGLLFLLSSILLKRSTNLPFGGSYLTRDVILSLISSRGFMLGLYFG